MRKPVISMPPIHISLASQTRSAQASAVTIASAAMTITRSRRKTASSDPPLTELFYDAALAKIDMSKLAIRIGEAHLYWAGHLRPAAAHFSKRIFKSVGDIDPCSMLHACDRIFDRLAAAFGDAAYNQPGLAGVDIDVEVDGREDRFVHFFQGGGKHLEDGGARLGILAAENAKERPALRLRRSLVDDDSRLALALVDRTGPAENADEPQTI